MGVSIINGKKYTYEGNGNVSIVNGVVTIDGKIINGKDDSKTIDIKIEGNIENLNIDYCQQIKITGDAGRIKTTSGDVVVEGNCNGNVSTTSGDIECGNVEGDIESVSGDINCKSIKGNAKTVSGNIK